MVEYAVHTRSKIYYAAFSSSPTFAKTSSMVVTETPKLSIPRPTLSASSLSKRFGNDGVEEEGRMKESSAPTSETCSASGTNDFTSCSTREETHEASLASVR